MTLVKSNLPVFPAFPRLFDDFFTRDLSDWGSRGFSNTQTSIPAVNIIENYDSFHVEMAAPGMDKEDFLIELDNEYLTISSKKEVRNELRENEQYTRREFSYQSFQRTFHLPKTVVDESKIKAEYKNGVLRIMIPKKEEARALPPRTIAIQ